MRAALRNVSSVEESRLCIKLEVLKPVENSKVYPKLKGIGFSKTIELSVPSKKYE